MALAVLAVLAVLAGLVGLRPYLRRPFSPALPHCGVRALRDAEQVGAVPATVARQASSTHGAFVAVLARPTRLPEVRVPPQCHFRRQGAVLGVLILGNTARFGEAAQMCPAILCRAVLCHLLHPVLAPAPAPALAPAAATRAARAARSVATHAAPGAVAPAGEGEERGFVVVVEGGEVDARAREEVLDLGGGEARVVEAAVVRGDLEEGVAELYLVCVCVWSCVGVSRLAQRRVGVASRSRGVG